MDLPVKLGDAHDFLTLVPSPPTERVAEDERLVLAAYRFPRGLGIWARRALASRIEHEVTTALHIVRPGTVVVAFDGAGTMSRARVHRLATGVVGEVSRSATNLVGVDTTVIGVVVMSPAERDLAAACVRHVAAQPPHRGDGLVFHASDLRRANIYELIEEAVL